MGKLYTNCRWWIKLFNNGELVILNSKNLPFKYTGKTLGDIMYRPFKVVSVGYNKWYYYLTWQESWKIHLKFTTTQFRKYCRKHPARVIVLIDEYDACCMMARNIACGSSDNVALMHVLLVRWIGFHILKVHCGCAKTPPN